jgi:hypothetical protein
MMYSFAARGDCAVWDEPFYGVYLARTGIDHPLREEILAELPTDAEEVERRILGPVPGGKEHFYQKHMTHHMVRGVPLGWVRDCVNVFLIRHPARVIASYVAKRENPTEDDIGFRRQSELFDAITALTGTRPPVIDASDVRADPAATLGALCAAIGLPFTERMLRWPAGGIAEDGPWASHWYGTIHRSTGFAGPEGPLPEIAPAQRDLLRAALPDYEKLSAFSL